MSAVSFEGQVIRGYGWPHKMPTANVEHNGELPIGVHTGICFLVEEDNVEVELGRCLMWVYPNTRVAEVFINGFEGDLYWKTIVIHGLESLNREHLVKMTKAGMNSVLG